MSHEAGILSDPIVWYTLALGIFFAGIYAKARKPVGAVLDAEIAKVRSELDQARKLRAEAEESLVDYEKKQKAAMLEAEAILAQAKADADLMREQAEAELKASIKAREEHALLRIQQAEHSALHEVRATVIDQALQAARKALAEKVKGTADEILIDQAIDAIPGIAEPTKAA